MHSVLSKRLSELQSFHNIENGLVGKTHEGYFRIRVFSESVFQIKISSIETFEDFSYSVIATPGGVAFSMEDHPESIVIKTAELELVILKSPVSFIFKNSSGIILNKDEEDLQVSLGR